jgi:hypothetical protein
MAVQAVFEIHMERNMEQTMKPSMIRLGLVPTKLRMARAILWCRPQCSTATAIIRPATNIMLVAPR